MSCKFSTPKLHSNKNILISSSHNLLAAISNNTVTLFSLLNYNILHLFSCVDKIDKIEFSYDFEYILCGIYNRSVIEIFSLNNFNWKCRINEYNIGIITTCWSPDSRHILIESDFNIQLSIWSLVENTSYIINSPKTNCYAFSDCHRLETTHLFIYFFISN